VKKCNSQGRETEFHADRDERINGEEGTGGNATEIALGLAEMSPKHPQFFSQYYKLLI